MGISGDSGSSRIPRRFGEPEDISLYCEFSSVLGTPNAVMVQFYETIPDPPLQDGTVAGVQCILRATITLSREHASHLGRWLLAEAARDWAPVPPVKGGKSRGGLTVLHKPETTGAP